MIRKRAMDALGRLHPEEIQTVKRLPFIFILDDVRSALNVGSIFRTADAFLVHSILLCGITPKPPHPDIYKTALGAIDTVPWLHFPKPDDALTHLRAFNAQIWVLEQAEPSIYLQSVNWLHQPLIACVLGNEVKGVGEFWLENAHQAVEIPQSGSKHSLNVSVAAGIVAWHCYAHQLFPSSDL